MFDEPAESVGGWDDGRQLVLAGDALFALDVSDADLDPVLVETEVKAAVWDAHGLQVLHTGPHGALRNPPLPEVTLREGKVVFPDRR